VSSRSEKLKAELRYRGQWVFQSLCPVFSIQRCWLKKYHLVYRTAVNAIPHISELMVDDLRSAIEHEETIVIGNAGKEFVDIMKLTDSDQIVVDLVSVVSAGVEEERYHGICW